MLNFGLLCSSKQTDVCQKKLYRIGKLCHSVSRASNNKACKTILANFKTYRYARIGLTSISNDTQILR